jgi:hypothetical protein
LLFQKSSINSFPTLTGTILSRCMAAKIYERVNHALS